MPGITYYWMNHSTGGEAPVWLAVIVIIAFIFLLIFASYTFIKFTIEDIKEKRNR